MAAFLNIKGNGNCVVFFVLLRLRFHLCIGISLFEVEFLYGRLVRIELVSGEYLVPFEEDDIEDLVPAQTVVSLDYYFIHNRTFGYLKNNFYLLSPLQTLSYRLETLKVVECVQFTLQIHKEAFGKFSADKGFGNGFEFSLFDVSESLELHLRYRFVHVPGCVVLGMDNKDAPY